MEYITTSSGVVLYEPDLELGETLDCGQAFRWSQWDENTYSGFYLNNPLTVSGKNGEFLFHNITGEEFEKIWLNYFDLTTDYKALKLQYSADETMRKACGFAGGIRLLRQDSWEALCSFIISQNNNIPRIKGIISRLCEHFNGFPTAEQLAQYSVDDLAFLRSGFRAKYLCDASRKVATGELDLKKTAQMPIDDARKALMTIKGVGPKVAECALLYGMYRIEAFPVDVWIKRVLEQFYPNGLPECIRGSEGIAQQFLFHYVRNL